MQDTDRQPATADEFRILVERFLSWRLPDTFAPDGFIHFDRGRAKKCGFWPIGTNLLTYSEASAMLEHVLGLDRPLRRAEDLSPQEVGEALEKGETLTVDHDPPDKGVALWVRAEAYRRDPPNPAIACPEFHTSEWPDPYGAPVDAEVWRGWDGTVVYPTSPPLKDFRLVPICPCPGQRVEVRHRDGEITRTDKPEWMRWGWTRPYRSDADIVAWRPIPV